MWHKEVTRHFLVLARPLFEKVAVLVEFDDARVAVAVRYEKVTVFEHGHVRRLAKVGLVIARDQRLAHGQRRLLQIVRREFKHLFFCFKFLDTNKICFLALKMTFFSGC